MWCTAPTSFLVCQFQFTNILKLAACRTDSMESMFGSALQHADVFYDTLLQQGPPKAGVDRDQVLYTNPLCCVVLCADALGTRLCRLC